MQMMLSEKDRELVEAAKNIDGKVVHGGGDD